MAVVLDKRPEALPEIASTALSSKGKMIDGFGRQITYLRLSVTDRCDLRCTYCMAERMTFLPKKDVLTLEELARLSSAFVRRGVQKIRITGGEPLVRKDILDLFKMLAREYGNGLKELTLTTNATRLAEFADDLAALGVKKVNVSLDSLDANTFARISRRAKLDDVLAGIEAALEAGIKVKINTVALKSDNAHELPAMVEWAHSKAMDMTLIEVMPLGETGEDRFDQYMPLPEVRAQLEERWTLTEETTLNPMAGPSRYVQVKETGGRLGFITPLSHNFCAGCNRMRVTCTGRIYMCLGQDDHIDLRQLMRDNADDSCFDEALREALKFKPEKHDFKIETPNAAPALERHMSMTGG